MQTSDRISATPVISLAAAIENAGLAIKKHLSAALAGVIWLSFLLCSLAVWPSFERMLLIKMRETISVTANHGNLTSNSLNQKRNQDGDGM